MFLGSIGRLPKPALIPACAKRASVYVAPPATYSIDFTVAATQDPLNDGGLFTNNTQGTGGNGAMGSMSSMRVGAAASGSINIAMGDSTGQSVPPASQDYGDSFAFLPGYPGNQRITAIVYRQAGYTPVSNHEIELLLGCRTAAGNHRWIESLWSADGGVDLVSLDGANSGFTVIGNGSGAGGGTGPADFDVWIAELYRSAGRVKVQHNGTVVSDLTHAAISNLGDGVGIGSYRHTKDGPSQANALGFRSITIEPF